MIHLVLLLLCLVPNTSYSQVATVRDASNTDPPSAAQYPTVRTFQFGVVQPLLQPGDSPPAYYTRQCPPLWPNDGSLACGRGFMEYTLPIDPSSLQDMIALFPETQGVVLTPDQLSRRAAFLDPSIDPNLLFTDTGYLEITLLAGVTNNRNQFGLFLFDNQRNIIPGSFFEVWPDVTMQTNFWKQNTFPLNHATGDSVTVGPFANGTRVGFYLHANGASNVMLQQDPQCLLQADALRTCISHMNFSSNTDYYACYTAYGCKLDPNLEDTAWTRYYSISRLNVDRLRHLAVIQDGLGGDLVLGFEDGWQLGDRDYNDCIVRIRTLNARFMTSLPRQCAVTCDALNGACNYTTGTCQCNANNASIYYDDCSCRTPCSCQNQGTCECLTGTCHCPNGFTGNQCECLVDPGTCINGATWQCDHCACPDGKMNPIPGYWGKGGVLVISSFTNAFPDSNQTASFGDFGWIHNLTPLLQGNQSIWQIQLTPNTFYNVTISLAPIDGVTRSSLVLESTLVIDSVITQPVNVTVSLQTNAQGTLRLFGLTATQKSLLVMILIQRPSCSVFIEPSSQCNQNGQWNYETGQCECNAGYQGSACQCAACLNGNLIESNCECDCLPGYQGSQCQCKQCPLDCLNNGTCQCQTGQCQCVNNFIGQQCECKQPLVMTCLNGGVMQCDTGQCNCPSGYYGLDCSLRACHCPSTGNWTCSPVTGQCFQQCAPLDHSCIANHGNWTCQGTCQCDATRHGPLCECLKCDNTCSDAIQAGRAVACVCQTGQCQCASGWNGTDCDLQLCSQPCLNGGQCQNGTCSCVAPFIGLDCSCVACDSSCNNCYCNGTCGDILTTTTTTTITTAIASTTQTESFATTTITISTPTNSNNFDSNTDDSNDPNNGDPFIPIGCDGIAWSGLVLDRCGVCGGNGSSCRAELLCQQRTECTTCQVKDSHGNQRCFWCTAIASVSNSSCHSMDYLNNQNSSCQMNSHCPLVVQNTTWLNGTLPADNSSPSTVMYSAVGAAGALVAGGAIATAFMKYKKSFVSTQQLWPLHQEQGVVTNPLYKDRTLNYENPMYQDPSSQPLDPDAEDD